MRSNHPLDLQTRSSRNSRRYSLVLDDADGGIAAAAVITLRGREATLELLAVEPGHEDDGIEERMIGVAEALREAFGCDRLVVPRAA